MMGQTMQKLQRGLLKAVLQLITKRQVAKIAICFVKTISNFE